MLSAKSWWRMWNQHFFIDTSTIHPCGPCPTGMYPNQMNMVWKHLAGHSPFISNHSSYVWNWGCHTFGFFWTYRGVWGGGYLPVSGAATSGSKKMPLMRRCCLKSPSLPGITGVQSISPMIRSSNIQVQTPVSVRHDALFTCIYPESSQDHRQA